MKQIIKKISLFILGFALIFTVSSKFVANAEEDGYREAGEAETSNVYGSMEVNTQRIETINNGTQDPSSSKYFWNNHTVHWVDFNPSNEVKVVTFSSSNADKWKQQTTRAAAKDWEKQNPGWIVVAGINGDFFENSGNLTYQPTGNFMQGGDMYRAEKAGADYRNTIGWNEDGSVIVGDPTISSDIYLKVYADDKETIESEIAISAVNKAPSATGITLITKDNTANVDLTGYKVLDCEYEICRISTKKMVFVKGTVKQEIKVSNGTPEVGHFYLAAKDGSLDNIQLDAYVKCEYSYTGSWSNVKNSIGYIYQVLADGQPQLRESTTDFAFTSHPRTLIGFREDGSTVFMVVEGRGKPADYQVGVSLYEAGQLLENLGCVSGYNLDGGGSSTLIVRNAYGSFDVVNKPSDGSERSDGNHVLVVMRDPGFTVDTFATTSTQISIKLNVNNEEYFSKLSNIKVECNGQTFDYDGSEILVPGVLPYTKYPITITYDSPSTYDETQITNKSYVVYANTPDYVLPNPGLKVTNITSTGFTVEKNMNLQTASYIQDVVVYVGKNSYNMGNAEKVVCEGLYKDATYNVHFEYTVKDPSGYEVEVVGEEFTIQTLSYDVPSVVKFAETKKSDDSVTFEYEYADEDKVAVKAYISCNGEVAKELATKSGTTTVRDLELGKENYEFKLVIEYLDAEGETVVVESDVLTYEGNGETGNPSTKPGTTGGCALGGSVVFVQLFSAISVLALAFRKRR